MRRSWIPCLCLAFALASSARADEGAAPQSDFEEWPEPGQLFDESELELDFPPPPSEQPHSHSHSSSSALAGSRPRREKPYWEDYEGVIRLEAFYLPVVGLRADEDRDEPFRGIEFPDVRTGSGFGARFGAGNEYVNVGLLYTASRHTTRVVETTLDAHSLFLDVLLGGALYEGPVELTLYLGAGVGGSVFDFAEYYKDEGGAALNLRVQGGLRVMEHLEFGGGAGWFFWGYPGETIGHAGWLQLSLTFRF